MIQILAINKAIVLKKASFYMKDRKYFYENRILLFYCILQIFYCQFERMITPSGTGIKKLRFLSGFLHKDLARNTK